MKVNKANLREAVHLSGSVASITAILLLLFENLKPNGVGIKAFVVLGLFTLILLGLISLTIYVIKQLISEMKPFDSYGMFGLWLLFMAFLIIILILLSIAAYGFATSLMGSLMDVVIQEVTNPSW